MKITTRILTCLIALLMFVSLFAACTTNPENPSDTTTPDQQSGNNPSSQNPGGDTSENTPGTSAEPTEQELNVPTIGNTYSGYTYNILATTNKMGDSDLYYTSFDGISGSAVSDALYNRALLMKDRYGVDVVVNIPSSPKDTLTNTIASGDYVCDIAMLSGRDSFSVALMGYLIDLNSLDELNLSASYWDQRIQKEYAVGEKLFFLEGDYTILDELRTYVCVYNDNLYRNLGFYDKYGSPYEMVSTGKWTMDRMIEMTAGMYEDVNSNGIRDEDDKYGMVGELTCAYYFFLGAGKQTIVNTNGQPTLVIDDSSSYSAIYDVISKTMGMAISDEVLLPQLLQTSDVWGAASKVFEEDRALFRSTALSAVTRLVNMSSDYGILPIPAYAENQDGYYCWVSGVNHCPLTIPTTVKDSSRTAALTEALCYHSRYGSDTLYDAFYEIMKISKLCRQPDDVAMLDLVFNSKTFDCDYTAQITGIEPSLYSIAKTRDMTSLNSAINGLKRAAGATLTRFLKQINK